MQAIFPNKLLQWSRIVQHDHYVVLPTQQEVLCPCNVNLELNLEPATVEVLVVSLAQILHYIYFIFESMSYLVYVSPKLAKDNLT
jgi:hypothetical protein